MNKLPDDLKSINSIHELSFLARKIRKRIVSVVSHNGGHLSSNLGSVDAIISILKVFDTKKNSIIFDVGHQCYAYKILTGRNDNFDTLRKYKGLSGFTNRDESLYDIFKSGHSGNSISLALGICKFKKDFNIPGKVIAFIGDGSMTCGLAYEGLNNSSFVNNLVIVLNDNSMSISRNVGAISKYLSKIRTNLAYLKTKKKIKNFLDELPIFGENLKNIFSKFNFKLRSLAFKDGGLFESLGLRYYGPIDGHDIYEMIRIFNIVKDSDCPVLVHIVTKKGKGYKHAEIHPDKFHGISRFNIKTGLNIDEKKETFTDVFGKSLCELASGNKKIYAITAAMDRGTGLSEFAKKFPERFSDVGIAESHAVAFAAGLSAAGYIPVFAVYSTFLQRCFDQLIHDVSMQNLKVVFAVDRAGFVGEDGESHQGIFDVSMFNSVPNLECYSPSFFDELKQCLKIAIESDNSVAVRYPKGSELFKPSWLSLNDKLENYRFYGNNKDILIVTYGRIFSFAAKIFDDFPEKFSILKINRIIPLDDNCIKQACSYKKILFFEESYFRGSVSEIFGLNLLKNEFSGKFSTHAINDFVKHASISEQLHESYLDYEGMLHILEVI